jgi:DNA-binding NtrC family response regulator
MSKPKHIAVMNDDADILNLLEMLLTEEGYRVSLLRESRGAQARLTEVQPDLAILDIRRGQELVGFELIELLTRDPAASQARQQHAAQLAHLNIPVLPTPFDLDALPRLTARSLNGVTAEPGR